VKGRRWLPWAGVTFGAVIVAGMGWIAVHHLRVRSLLRDLRADVESYRPPSLHSTARVLDIMEDLQSHGCRALPAVIGEFHSEAPSAYLEGLHTILYHIMSDLAENDYNLQTRYRALDILRPLEITWRDPPAEVRRKCEEIRRWWSEEGHRYHQNWRFWSTNCGAR